MGAVVEVLQSLRWQFLSVCLCSCVCGGNSNITKVYFKQCSVYQIQIVFIHRYLVKAIAVMLKMEEIWVIYPRWGNYQALSCFWYFLWKLRLNYGISCLISLFTGDAASLALCPVHEEWKWLEDAIKVGDCQRNTSWCTNVQMFCSFHISILNSLFRPVCLRIKLSQSSAKTYVEVGRVSWEKGLILSSQYSAQLGPPGDFCLWNWVPFFVRGPLFPQFSTKECKRIVVKACILCWLFDIWKFYAQGRPCVWMFALIQFLDNFNIIAIKHFLKSWYMGPHCIWSPFCSKLDSHLKIWGF